MARPQVVDGGDSLQILQVYLISSRRQPTRDGPPAWGLGVGLPTLTIKNKLVTKIHKKLQTCTDSFDKRPKRKKMDMRFGTWNVRSMYRAGLLRVVGEEMSKCR
jgi:hypothetical protein